MSSVYLKPKNVAKVAVLPGIFPRLKALFGGFDYLPFLVAQLYKNFGLLPHTHPYLQNANIGRYGIVSIFAEAGRRLTYDRYHIDKILLFYASLASFLLFALMLASSILFAVVNPVWASGIMSTIFITPYPETDIAFELLSRVFGTVGIYDPSFTQRSPFHAGLHAMFSFYSQCLFFIALAYFLYYMFAVVAETAIAGTPFGKRFHKIWGPLRLMVAVGLLVPFGAFGFNTAQYIVLYTAKFSSGMATNAWIAFNQRATQPFGYGRPYESNFPPQYYATLDGQVVERDYGTYQTRGLVSVPEVPSVSELAKNIDIVHTCMVAYQLYHDIEIKPYLVKSDPKESIDLSTQPSFDEAHAFSGMRDIVIHFGEYDEQKHEGRAGYVRPYCGSFTVPATQGGRTDILAFKKLFYDLIVEEAFNPNSSRIYGPSRLFAERMISGQGTDFTGDFDSCDAKPAEYNIPDKSTYPPLGDCNGPPAALHRVYMESEIRKVFDEKAYPEMRRFLAGETGISSPDEIALYGWAGAGIWYNRIADMNADVLAAFTAIPKVNRYPEIMEYVKGQRLLFDEETPAGEQFDPSGLAETNSRFNNPKNQEIATILDNAFSYWNIDDTTADSPRRNQHNFLVRAIALVFGANPILNIRENENVHPFAKLSAVGKGLIENAILQLGAAGAQSFIAGVLNSAQSGLGGTFSGGAALSKSIAFAGLTAGFLLYYIVPFLPFLYFFFAVGGWVKSIFEAMVGAPLWALAHFQFEGDSLITKQAQGGYFLLLEVMVRPIMALAGLIASTAIFGAAVTVLDLIFELVTTNLPSTQLDAGRNLSPTDIAYYRSAVDQLFFTVMYVILVYLMGTSAFKLTDDIPNNIIRWINGGVKSFGDTAGDSAEQLTTYASIAGYRFAPQIGEAVSSMGEGLGGMAGDAMGENTIKRMVGINPAPAAGTAAAESTTTGNTPQPSGDQPQGTDQQRTTTETETDDAPRDNRRTRGGDDSARRRAEGEEGTTTEGEGEAQPQSSSGLSRFLPEGTPDWIRNILGGGSGGSGRTR